MVIKLHFDIRPGLYWSHDLPLPLVQIDVIEENVRLYDCMTHSEKQFIIEVCTL